MNLKLRKNQEKVNVPLKGKVINMVKDNVQNLF